MGKSDNDAVELRKMDQAVVEANWSFHAEREWANALEDELRHVKQEQDEYMVKSSNAKIAMEKLKTEHDILQG